MYRNNRFSRCKVNIVNPWRTVRTTWIISRRLFSVVFWAFGCHRPSSVPPRLVAARILSLKREFKAIGRVYVPSLTHSKGARARAQTNDRSHKVFFYADKRIIVCLRLNFFFILCGATKINTCAYNTYTICTAYVYKVTAFIIQSVS